MARRKSKRIEKHKNVGMLDAGIEACRICNGDLKLIKMSQEIYTKFKIFSKVKVYPDIRFSEYICLTCRNKLKRCVQFYWTIKRSEKLKGLFCRDKNLFEDPFHPVKTNFRDAPLRTYSKSKLNSRMDLRKRSTNVNNPIFNVNPSPILSNFFSCDDCNINFDGIKQFYAHRRKHFSKLMESNIKSKVSNVFPVGRKKLHKHTPCKICSTVFLTSKVYNLECKPCHLSLSKCEDLIAHFRYHHNAARGKHICLKCLNSFYNPVQYLNHIDKPPSIRTRCTSKLVKKQKGKLNREYTNFTDKLVIRSTSDQERYEDIVLASGVEMKTTTLQQDACFANQLSEEQLSSPGKLSRDGKNLFGFTFPSDSTTIQEEESPFQSESCDSQSSLKTLSKKQISLCDLHCSKFQKTETQTLPPYTYYTILNKTEDSLVLQNNTAELFEKLNTEPIEELCHIVSNKTPDSIIMQTNTELLETQNIEPNEEDLIEVMQIVELEDDLPSEDVTNDP